MHAWETRKKGPVYLQIVDNILHDIARGKLAPDEKLPSVRELAESMGVNPNTVIHAYTELERMGITYTRRGQGTYVRPDVPQDLLRKKFLEAAARKFWAEVEALGLSLAEAVQALEEVVHGGSSVRGDQEIRKS
ncbi:GntR family transcriptional regulator [Candidatus Bipolaricaulota bacterium]|nr:GntR family transcriptional regulator [Candidatus Bipolaricaulota bacterium]